MELFLLHHEKWELEYNNCSGIDTTPLPWDQRRYIPESLLLIVLCTIYYILYVPCMYSFWRNRRDENGHANACYLIMLYISVVDMAILWIISFGNASLFLSGTTCSHPTLNYLLGAMATSVICAETMADGVLAANRCADILFPKAASFLFKGKRVWFWLIPGTLHGLSNFIMNRPVVFNGFIFANTLNPYKGFWEDGHQIFTSPQLSMNELFLTFSTPIIYLLFAIGLWWKTRSMGSIEISNMQKAAFYQVFIISFFNMFAGTIYFVIEHFPNVVTPGFIVLGHFAWVHIHGIPPVIYIMFNKTVRYEFRKAYMKIFKPNRIRHLHGVTVVVPTKVASLNKTGSRPDE